MEGRVDENNRSLLPNPFVSTVLIHPSKPPAPSTQPAPLTLPQPLPLHQLPGAPTTYTTDSSTETNTRPPDSRAEVHRSRSHPPKQAHNSGSTLSLLSSCSSPWPLGTSLSSGSLAFVCLCKHILILHQRVNVCVL